MCLVAEGTRNLALELGNHRTEELHIAAVAVADRKVAVVGSIAVGCAGGFDWGRSDRTGPLRQ